MSYFSDVERMLVVSARTQVATGVVAFDLRSPNGRDLPEWTPGSHVDVRLPDGVERQYSLCGDLADRGAWRIAVLREVTGRGGSEYLHAVTEVGQQVRVRGPRNHFAFTPSAGHRYVFVAGGIGITPLVSMIEAAVEAGVEWSLDYAGRTTASMAFARELADRHGERVRLHAGDTGARLDLDALAVSVVGSSVVGDELVEVYSCGPARLLSAVEAAFASLPEGAVHLERFEAKEYGEPVWPEPFEVELDLSGITVTVPPGRSILEVVEEHDVVVPASCRTGTCGTCETPVIEGEVEHRDSILTAGERAENAVMMICVSRAACPRLVLEL